MIDFFDAYIEKAQNLLDGFPSERFAYNPRNVAQVSSRSELVLLRDAAYELGGSDLSSVGFSLVTSKSFESETLVVGNDLGKIKSDVPFAKIVILGVEDFSGDEQTLFNEIKDLEHAKYKLNVEGFMTRASSMNHREQVRVSKQALKDGLTFERIGNTLISEYLKEKGVKAVRIIFATDAVVCYEELTKIAEKTSDILDAFNHMYDNLMVDCKSCNLKAICDEVEGMRELHFKSVQKKNNNSEANY